MGTFKNPNFASGRAASCLREPLVAIRRCSKNFMRAAYKKACLLTPIHLHIRYMLRIKICIAPCLA